MSAATFGDDEEAPKRPGANSPPLRPSICEEQAESILWLCGEASSYVTETTIVSDGGMTIRHPSSRKRATD